MGLFNRMKAPYFKGIIGGHTVTVDYDEAHSDITLWKRTDMVIATTEIISQRYSTNTGEHVWLHYEIGYNAAGALIYHRKCDHTVTPPDWAPVEILS